MPNRVFLNYRRIDSQDETDRLYQILCRRFGKEQVFRDLDTIRKGTDFARIIDENLRSCAAAVVIIGRDWLNVRDPLGRRRLTQRSDFVRMEIRALLQRGIPVIPVLVRGAAMPDAEALPPDLRPMVRRQIAMLRPREFERDASLIARELEASLGFYHGPMSPELASGLSELRTRIEEARIPTSTQGRTLNLATWNIRELGRRPRRAESLHYIAELLSQFDLIAVSEAQRYNGDLRSIQRILGPFWRVLFSGGFCFVFDSRKAELGGMARQVTGLPEFGLHRSEAVELPFWRNPFVVSFRAGSTEFICVLVHVRWGNVPGARIEELAFLARWLPRFRQKELFVGQRLVVLGTFQTPDLRSREFKALAASGLQLPPILRRVRGSNLRGDHYWQSIMRFSDDREIFTRYGGVLDFRPLDFEPLYEGLKLTPAQVTRELSDNLPLWVQLKVE